MKKRNMIISKLEVGSASILLITFLMSSPVFGNEDEGQLDNIENKIDTVITTQKKILDVVDPEPLMGKNYGIEINPLRFLFLDEDEKSFSGSFSFFNVKPNVEISIPIFISNVSSSFSDTEDFSVFTIDGHYRYFLGKNTNGFYISGFSRFATLNGTFGDDYSSFGRDRSKKSGRTYKLGGGFGLGYRVFSKSGIYWGASLSVGRYLIGDSDQYRSANYASLSDMDDSKVIFDVEFFKIGYAF